MKWLEICSSHFMKWLKLKNIHILLILNILRAYIDFADSLIFVNDFYKKKKKKTYSSQYIFCWYCVVSDKKNLKVAKIFNPSPDDKIVYLSKVKELVNDKLGGH